MIDITQLNGDLEDYLQKNNREFYIINLGRNIELLSEIKNLIDPYQDKEKNKIRFTEKIDGVTSIQLVREYLATLGTSYVEKFDEAFQKGIFGFDNSKDRFYSYSLNRAGVRKGHNYFNVDFKGTLLDSNVLIHEFFHYLNESTYRSRELLTEFISIYMENEYLEFLEQKGYSKNEISKMRVERYLDFYDLTQDLYYETTALNLENKLGPINKKDIHFIKMYQDKLIPSTFEDKDYYKMIEVVASEFYGSSRCKFDPVVSYEYFFGTLLSSYLLTRKDKDTTKKILELNEKLANGISYSGAFKILDIDINSIKDSEYIESVNQYYGASISTLNDSKQQQESSFKSI